MSNDSVNNEEQTTLEKTLIEKESTNTKTAVLASILNKKTTGADSGAGGAGEGARGTQPLLGMNETRSGQNIRPRRSRLDSGERYNEKTTTRTKIRDFCEDPSFSRQAFWFHTIFSMVIVGSIICFIASTNNDNGNLQEGGFTPDDFSVLEAIFTFIFITDISVRFAVADVKCCFFRKPYEEGSPMALDPLFLLDILSVLPYPLEIIARGVGMGDYTTLLSFFNLFRICRIFKITRQFDGTKVLVATVRKSSEAIIIQVLFLLTMVFTFGFLLYLFEPCLGTNTTALDDSCEFPDLIQSSYFLFITITTVGYGDQIPVTTMGKILAVLLAILGSFYMAMPLAIIGSKFEEAYQEREIYKLKKKGQDVAELFKAELDKVPLNKRKQRMTRLMLKLNANLRSLVKAGSITGSNTYNTTCVVLDRLLSDLRSVYESSVSKIKTVHPSQKKAAAKNLFKKSFKGLKVYKKKAASIVPSTADKAKSSNMSNSLLDIHSIMKKGVQQPDYAQTTFQYEQEAKLDKTFRNTMWLIFEVPTSSTTASRFNFFKMFIIATSLLLLIIQSMSMFNYYAEDSRMCRQIVNFYCEKLDSSPETQKLNPACFKHDVEIAGETINYPGCRGLTASTFNDCGFPNAQLGYVCKDVYGPNETNPFDDKYFHTNLKLIPVCQREQCVNSLPDAVDNSRLWLTLETIFAVLFSVEICIRLYLMRSVQHFFRNPYNVVDVITGLICLAEVIYIPAMWAESKFEIWGNGVGSEPANIRVLRLGVFMRFVSLQRHFVGLKVILLTIKAVWKKMIIPLLFFIIFVLLFAGMFYTVERGSLYECVGDSYNTVDCVLCRPSTHNLYDATCKLKVVSQFSTVELLEPKVQNMWDSIWTMFITTTTVGYGGRYPQTVAGQIVSVFAAIFGSFYLSMPLTIVGNSFYSIFDKEWNKVLKRRNTRLNLNYVTSTKKKAYGGLFSLGLIVKLKMWAKRATRKLRHAELNKYEQNLVHDYFDAAHEFMDLQPSATNIAEKLIKFSEIHAEINEILASHFVNKYEKWIHPSERIIYK